MNEITNAVVTIATAIVGVAILAVLVSQRSNTAGVLSAGGGAFAQMLSAATAPVTGNSGTTALPFGGVGGFSNSWNLPMGGIY